MDCTKIFLDDLVEYDLKQQNMHQFWILKMVNYTSRSEIHKNFFSDFFFIFPQFFLSHNGLHQNIFRWSCRIWIESTEYASILNFKDGKITLWGGKHAKNWFFPDFFRFPSVFSITELMVCTNLFLDAFAEYDLNQLNMRKFWILKMVKLHFEERNP